MWKTFKDNKNNKIIWYNECNMCCADCQEYKKDCNKSCYSKEMKKMDCFTCRHSGIYQRRHKINIKK